LTETFNEFPFTVKIFIRKRGLPLGYGVTQIQGNYKKKLLEKGLAIGLWGYTQIQGNL
jgi:hypothetical protein